jgi:DNA topoisomerase-1
VSKTLVVVESPAKAKTIEKFLGKNYIVRASMGHLRDLPKSQFGVNVEQDFEPKYINIRGKGDLIKALKEAAKTADKVFLATDPDREGEAIAWHLAHILTIDPSRACRIEFNEITKSAIQNAVKHPRPLDISKIDAQQGRRILDRIVGYKLSPLLWRKVRKGLSAGRVQSVAVRLICDREKEIQAFVPEEYWTVTAKLREKLKAPVFDAELVTIEGQKAQIGNEDHAMVIKTHLEESEFTVTDVKKRERRRNPIPPFTTSSLQQDASRKLGFTSRKIMMLAQQLYEGLEIGKSGHIGLITYIRTDSNRVSESAQSEARSFITTKYGAEYLPDKAPIYTSKKNAQDAHEAIRPTSVELPPESVIAHLSKDQYKLYSLIWDRFIASQMTAAIYDTLTIEIKAGQYGLRATGSHLKFAGFMAVYTESKEGEEQDKDVDLPELTAGQSLKTYKILPKQHFTQPPPRYTEASLVKILEEKGIGRPSTYAPIIDTIVTRGYVEKIERKFQPTELGCLVVDLLKQYFENIVDVEFTANMEDRLDDVAEGEIPYKQVLRDFYQPFAETLSHAEEEIGQVELPVEVSDVQCEACGRFMVVKKGRYGSFLACPGFPACRNTKAIVKDTGVTCPKCQGAIIERRTKRGKVFYGCQKYPECDYVTWDTPLKEVCQTCGTFMLKRGFKKGGAASVCGNPACPTQVESTPKTSKAPKATKTTKATKTAKTAKRRNKSG